MRRGFTLIEVMVAMAILVIVIGSTLAIFRASATSWRKGELRAQRYQQARFILERLTREISSIVPASLAGPYCFGTAEKLYFVCSQADAPSSLIEVGYWMDQGAQELVRGYQSPPDYNFNTFKEEEVFSENLSALNFQYSAGEMWQEDWDSRPGGAQSGILPKAVKIGFDIQDNKGTKTESFSTVVTLPVAHE